MKGCCFESACRAFSNAVKCDELWSQRQSQARADERHHLFPFGSCHQCHLKCWNVSSLLIPRMLSDRQAQIPEHQTLLHVAHSVLSAGTVPGIWLRHLKQVERWKVSCHHWLIHYCKHWTMSWRCFLSWVGIGSIRRVVDSAGEMREWSPQSPICFRLSRWFKQLFYIYI